MSFEREKSKIIKRKKSLGPRHRHVLGAKEMSRNREKLPATSETQNVFSEMNVSEN